jgi:predicted RNA binding protein YcfA (HicA-like mRNA interferase family)
MGKRRFPPLKHREIIEILTNLEFVPCRKASSSHTQYERPDDGIRGRRIVTVDDYEEFDETLIKIMISQSGFSREDFYGACKKTSKKI